MSRRRRRRWISYGEISQEWLAFIALALGLLLAAAALWALLEAIF